MGRETKRAKVPKSVWDDRKNFAHKWGSKHASVGFTLRDKLLFGDYKVTKTKRRSKTVYIIEFD